MKITDVQVKEIAEKINLTFAHLKAFLTVESGSKGFDEITGKIIIQFEPKIFSTRSGLPVDVNSVWGQNTIDVQSKEWLAFNDAYKVNANVAMESTSIGLPQIMGFHWRILGYSTVGAMWEDFKISEVNQVQALGKFITVNTSLHTALLNKDWATVASIYNGKGYLELAKRINREPYNISLEKAFNKYGGI